MLLTEAEERISSHEALTRDFGSISIVDDDGCLCLPPLDLITACTDDDDASSSVSSMSSNAEDFETPPRIIFKSYWEKNISKSTLSPSYERAGHKRRLFSESSTSETYELSVSVSSALDEDKSSHSCHQRRKIFGDSGGFSFTRSEPQLATSSVGHELIFRKTRSLSTLYSSMPKSCLRRGRFSGKSCTDQSDSDLSSSVSFKPDVDVVVFELPMEQHAQKGWSKFFV